MCQWTRKNTGNMDGPQNLFFFQRTSSSAARPASPRPYPVLPPKWWGPTRAEARAA